MLTARTGIILNVENFDDCLAFYRDLFELEVMFEEQDGDFRLACLAFDNSYLMIETHGFAIPEGKSERQSPTKLRFNVENIEDALAAVQAFGIDAEIDKNDWGSTINLFDPDGNRVGIRDEATFKAQIKT